MIRPGFLAGQAPAAITNPRGSHPASHFVIRPGFEPGTHSLEGCCSIQLSYRTILMQRPTRWPVSAVWFLVLVEVYAFEAYHNETFAVLLKILTDGEVAVFYELLLHEAVFFVEFVYTAVGNVLNHMIG